VSISEREGLLVFCSGGEGDGLGIYEVSTTMTTTRTARATVAVSHRGEVKGLEEEVINRLNTCFIGLDFAKEELD